MEIIVLPQILHSDVDVILRWLWIVVVQNSKDLVVRWQEIHLKANRFMLQCEYFQGSLFCCKYIH